MPSYLVVGSSPSKFGVPIDGLLCEYPSRCGDIPVKVTISKSEKTLLIDNEGRPRRIISAIGESGTTTYLIDGQTNNLRNRERRAALARAQGILERLRSTILPLKASSEEPEYVVQALQMLFDWLRDERERLSGV